MARVEETRAAHTAGELPIASYVPALPEEPVLHTLRATRVTPPHAPAVGGQEWPTLPAHSTRTPHDSWATCDVPHGAIALLCQGYPSLGHPHAPQNHQGQSILGDWLIQQGQIVGEDPHYVAPIEPPAPAPHHQHHQFGYPPEQPQYTLEAVPPLSQYMPASYQYTPPPPHPAHAQMPPPPPPPPSAECQGERTRERRRLITTSTISVVSRLALEFKRDDATKLTTATLIKRLRISEPYAEAAVAHNLVDLALKAPESSFLDIIKAFSHLSLSLCTPKIQGSRTIWQGLSQGPADLPQNNLPKILAAQPETGLTYELDQRPEFYSVYLQELLLFRDKGIAVKKASVQNRYMKAEDLAEWLVSLLLPIDALLSHADLNSRFGSSPTGSLVSQYVIPLVARRWSGAALVLEEVNDLLVGDIEHNHNSSIRQEYVHGKYLAVNQSLSPIDTVDLSASIAENYGKAIGPVQRLCTTSLAALSKHKPDRAKIVTSQIASKAYYTGEIAGLRLAGREGLYPVCNRGRHRDMDVPVISERPAFEIAMMAEINAAWMTSIKLERGIFSKTLNYDDPFYHRVDCALTDKDVIDRATSHARRPHALRLADALQ
ncbi:hypothetical protein BC826DRAFT_1186196 [Russula brevipes]|nr:hypothetical protein BC826DRAFT_1186196 [Russula brevipes]